MDLPRETLQPSPFGPIYIFRGVLWKASYMLCAHRNNRVNSLLLKLWLPPSSPTSKRFLLKKSQCSLLLKSKDNHIKTKVQAGASNDRTLKSPLEFVFPWTLPKMTIGRPILRMHAHFRLLSLSPLCSQTILTQINELEVAFSWDEMGDVQHFKKKKQLHVTTPLAPHHNIKYQEEARRVYYAKVNVSV